MRPAASAEASATRLSRASLNRCRGVSAWCSRLCCRPLPLCHCANASYIGVPSGAMFRRPEGLLRATTRSRVTPQRPGAKHWNRCRLSPASGRFASSRRSCDATQPRPCGASRVPVFWSFFTAPLTTSVLEFGCPELGPASSALGFSQPFDGLLLQTHRLFCFTQAPPMGFKEQKA